MDRGNTFCSLCGRLIENHDGSPVTDEGLPWDFEVRAIRTRAYVHDPFVTGLGWLNFYHEVCADLREGIKYTDTNVDLEAHELRYTSQQYWCYPVHGSCWDLLRCSLDPGNRLDPNRVARHLFALLYNTPTDGQGIPDLVFQTNRPQSRFYLQHDPLDEFGIDLSPEPAPDLLPNISALTLMDSGDVKTVDVFRRLPGEIVVMVLERLPSKSVYNLRLSSRYVAVVSRTPLLPQSFWLSRFEDNHEMAFVFANNTRILPLDPIDWRQLYIKAKMMLTNPRMYPGFQNRFQIWQTLGAILPPLSLRIANEKYIVKAPYSGTNPRLDGFVSRGIAAGELTYEHSSSMIRNNSATTELEAGCRLFEKQSLPWLKVPSTNKVVKMAFSFIEQDDRTYISGLRLLSERDGIEYARAGYINLATEQTIDLGPSDILQTFTVNIVIEGIVGLGINLTGSNGSFFHTIGTLDAIKAESGLAKLGLQGNLSRHCFLVGMDVSWTNLVRPLEMTLKNKTRKSTKLVSIEILEETADLPAGIKDQPINVNDDLSVDIWNPKKPGDELQWHSPIAFPRQSFNLCLDIDFGGPDGQLLPMLTMVNVFMGESPAVFYGMSFVYSDGKERLYGNKSYRLQSAVKYNCIVQSFPIAGVEGEFINRIETSYSKSNDTIRTLSFSTNAGRNIDFLLYDDVPLLKTEPSRTVIEPSHGCLFVAFCAKLKSPGSCIRDFTARSSVTRPVSLYDSVGLTMKNPKLFPVTRSVLKSAQEMLAYQSGFAFTAATLIGIREIHISIGADGLSRGTKHISGLRFIYEDSDIPVIIGQWMTEFACLELGHGEYLAEITTWHDFTNRISRVKFGPTVGIRFATSKGTVKTFLQHDAENKVCLQYRRNRYEYLSGMLWGCNYRWDHVRVLYQPKSSKLAEPLTFSPVDRHIPEWIVREKVFVEDMNADGSPDAVSSIAVSFKNLSGEPSGLSFIYQSGKKQTLGYWGERPQVEILQENEKLTRMEIGVSQGHRIGRIILETDQKRRLVFIHPSNRAGDAYTIQNTEAHWLQRTPDVSPAKGTKNIFEVPEEAGDFVGIWAIPKRHDHSLKYSMFGPIFERKHMEH